MAIQKGFSKRDFSAGQYDREYQAVQSDVSNRGMVYSRNVISSPLREAKTRAGTKFLKLLNGASKIIPYRIDEQDIALVVENGKISGWRFDENFNLEPFMVSSGGGTKPTFPIGGWTSNTNGNWSVALSMATRPNETYLMCNDDYRWGPLITQPNPADISTATLNITNSSTACVLRSFIIRFGLTTVKLLELAPMYYLAWSNPILQFSDNGSSWTSVKTAQVNPKGNGIFYKESTDTTAGASNARESSVIYRIENISNDLTPHRYWRVLFNSLYSEPAYATVYANNRYQEWHVSISDIDKVDNKDVRGPQFFSTGGTISQFTSNIPIYLQDFSKIKYSQGNDQLMIAVQGKSPYEIRYANNSFTAGNFIPSETPDLWSFQGFPSCVAHFSNRLWFGGLSLYRNRIISSQFGNYNNFTQPTGSDLVNAASPIIADCNQMRSIITDLFGGLDVLYAQCTEGIATATSGNAAIAANNMEFLLKVDKRSAGIAPAVKDNVMFYVSKDRRNIYAIQFDLIADKYQISDITKFSHSYLGSGIEGLFYPDTYERLIYGHLTNGKMFALLYDVDYQVIGFYPLETDGSIYDFSVIQANGEVRLLAVVERDGMYMLEIFNPVQELLDTNEFGVPDATRNANTKTNLINQPFIDCAQSVKDERMEPWIFNASNMTVYPNGSGSNLQDRMQQVIRFLTATNEVYDLKIIGYNNGAYSVEIVQGAPANATFNRLQMPITVFGGEVIPNKTYQYFDSGRYMGEVTADLQGVITVDKPVYDAVYGFGYRKIGVIQDNQTYLRKKKWGSISLNVMDTLSLKIGSRMDRLEDVMAWRGDGFFDSSPIMRNGILVSNIADEPENDKQLIFMTDEGLPFCIRAIEAAGEITDRNQN